MNVGLRDSLVWVHSEPELLRVQIHVSLSAVPLAIELERVRPRIDGFEFERAVHVRCTDDSPHEGGCPTHRRRAFFWEFGAAVS